MCWMKLYVSFVKFYNPLFLLGNFYALEQNNQGLYLHNNSFLQDRFLPIANVARIMKKSIPKSGKVNFKSYNDYHQIKFSVWSI